MSACAPVLFSPWIAPAAPVPLVDSSFEAGAPGSTLSTSSPGVDGGWWMNPAIYPGGSAGMIYVDDSGAADGFQTLLVGYANQLRSVEQTVSTTFSAASDYTLTVFGRAIGAGNEAELRLEFFRGDTGTRVGRAGSHVIQAGADRDVSVTITAGDIITAKAAGHEIGVRISKTDLLGEDTELRVDHVGLEETATADAFQLVMETGGTLAGWVPIERRYVSAEEGNLEYRLRLEPIASVDLQDPGFESRASGEQFPTTDPGIDGGWWRDTSLFPGGNGGMIHVNDASAGDGGERVALLGFPPELRSLQQTVGTDYLADTDYTLTVYSRAVTYGSFAENEQVDLTVTMFHGETGAAIKEQTFVVVKGETGSLGDKTLTTTAAEIDAAGAVGAPVGIRLSKSALHPPVGSSPDGRIELRVDNIRLTHTPVPGVLGLRTETSPDMRNWSRAGLRRVTPGSSPAFYRLEIEPLPTP